MDAIKCNNCQLINLASDFTCRRCGRNIGFALPSPTKDSAGASSFRSLFYTVVALTLVGSAVAYVFLGFEKSYEKIGASETNRIAQQPRNQPLGLTRSQFQSQQAGHYGSAIQNSNGLAESQKHVEDVKKLMESPK
jgi:hypothetical protein